MKQIGLAFVAPLLVAGASPERAARHWIDRHAIALASTDPDAPATDGLARLCDLARDARIMAFGEATHGSREFFQLKHRAFEFLVEKCGFRGFAIEANFSAAEAIDRWVKGGEGDPEQLISGMGFWTWDTEEVLAVLRWMRFYNDEHPDKIGFYGIDIQHAKPNLQIALDYLARFNDSKNTFGAKFAPYMDAAVDQKAGYAFMAALSDDRRKGLLAEAERLDEYLVANRSRLEAASGADDYAAARAGAAAAAWYFLMEGAPADRRFRNLRSGYDIRDRAMADLAKMAQARLPGDAPLFIWAHNAHVAKVRFEGDRMTMGQFLSAELGTKYVAAGFAFDHGSFQAIPPADPAQPGAPARLVQMDVPPAPLDHSEAVLRGYKRSPLWIADLRRLDPGSPAYSWFWSERPLRWTGANYSTALMAKHKPISLAAHFDLLIFVAKTSRARPLSRTRERLYVTKDW